MSQNGTHIVRSWRAEASVGRQVLVLCKDPSKERTKAELARARDQACFFRSAHDFIACLSVSAIISETATIDSVELMQLALGAREPDRGDDARLAPGAKTPAGQRLPEVVVDART